MIHSTRQTLADQKINRDKRKREEKDEALERYNQEKSALAREIEALDREIEEAEEEVANGRKTIRNGKAKRNRLQKEMNERAEAKQKVKDEVKEEDPVKPVKGNSKNSE